MASLCERSARYVAAARQRAALAHRRPAPERRHVPAAWQFDVPAHPRGLAIYVRRTTERGAIHVLGRTFTVDPLWGSRLVRCEIDLTAERLRCYVLRRRTPDDQPLLADLPYALPRRRFSDRP